MHAADPNQKRSTVAVTFNICQGEKMFLLYSVTACFDEQHFQHLRYKIVNFRFGQSLF